MNPQPPDLESDALPLELLACNIFKFHQTRKTAQGHSEPTVLPGFPVRGHFLPSSSNDPSSVRNRFSNPFRIEISALFCLFMQTMLPAEAAVFFQLQLVRCCPFVFCRRIIFPLALRARELHIHSHRCCPPAWTYSMISLTTPAPTVRPPSRTAKRSSFSMAIGVISSPVMVTLSPGITISTPSGSVNIPVTSVVRK